MTTKAMTGIAIALATLLASPAFAQVNQRNAYDGYNAYAQEYQDFGPQGAIGDGRQHSPNPAWDVYNTNGRYVGSDPDPNVREMIARDRQEQLGNGF